MLSTFRRSLPLFGMLLLTTAAHAQNFFGLGVAGPQSFAVLNLAGNFQFNSDGTSALMTITGQNGNVGLESGSSTSISGGSQTTCIGALYLGTGLSDPGGANFMGGVILNDARLGTSGSAVTAATTAATTLAALAPDQTITLTNSPTTISATHAGQNVIKISNNITNNVTLSPGAFSNVSFVVNVAGKIQLSGGNGLLTSGIITDQSIIYNVVGTVSTSGGGAAVTSHGIILAPNSTIQWDAVQLNGELIGKAVAVVSGGRVNNNYVSANTPEPGSIALLTGLALSAAPFLYRRRLNRR
jgi:hypothetical protein